MVRLIISVLLIAVAVVGFVVFTNPMLQEVRTLRAEAGTYDEALGNSKALENERDKLTQKYNTILPENLRKIEKLLPDNVDNIRLILEIEKLAQPYGMTLRDVKYDTITKKEDPVLVQGGAPDPGLDRSQYGIWTLEFNTSATYDNFLNFLKVLETNLRIVDVSSIGFSSSSLEGANPNLAEVYKYSFKISTYWLKN